MIKRFLAFCLLLLTVAGTASAQENVFVLVDVSGNPRGISADSRITAAMRTQAGDLVKQLALGNFDKARFMQDWRLSGNTDPQIQNIVDGSGKPLIEQGGYLLIMPFGDKDTYDRFKLNKIDNLPGDVDRAWRMPTQYTDQNTFGEIARAKAADVAIDANLKGYYLVVISGLGEDTNSANLYTSQEQDYMDNYRSAVRKNALGIFRYRDNKKDYKIEVSKIDLTRMRNAANTTGTKRIIDSSNVDKPIVEIITPKGNRRSPYSLKGDKLNVTWSCIGCTKDTEYSVKLLHMENRGASQTQKVKGRTNHTFSMTEGGPYRVVVSNNQGSSSTEFITYEGSGGGGSFLLWLLIIAALAALGYFLYTKLYSGSRKSPAGVVDNDDDFFADANRKKKSRNTGSTTGSSGSSSADTNSDYF